MASVYEINKGVNRALEFKGIKAQYIIYLAAGLVILLLLFATLFIAGVNTYVCIGLIIPLGIFLFIFIQYLSNKFGEYGLMKKIAQKQLPKAIQSRSRKVFIQFNKLTA